MLKLLGDGVWEADARLELDELAKSVDGRLVSEDDEVDTLGLVFLLAGHIRRRADPCFTSPAGDWKRSIPGNPRRIIRVRLRTPEPTPRHTRSTNKYPLIIKRGLFRRRAASA